MHFYKTPANIPFLDNVANFIIKNFTAKSMPRLKVILPNGFTCLNLQKILVKKQNIAILPNIIPFSNIMAEGLEVFGVTPTYISQITALEEKLILTEIIDNYPGNHPIIVDKDSWHQSLQFYPTLAKFLRELLSNNITIDQLANLENSHYWQSAYSFLQYVYQEWQRRLKKLKKHDNINYQITMHAAEISRINRPGESVIIAGILGDNHIAWNFLKDVASCPAAFIILPPFGELEVINLQSDANKDGLYCLGQLLKYLGKDLTEFISLDEKQQRSFDSIGGNENEYGNVNISENINSFLSSKSLIETNLCSNSSILDRLLTNENKQQSFPKALPIELLEFNTIYDEAERLALICKANQDKQIAIIVNSAKTKDFYCNFLAKYYLEFQDLIGHKLLYTDICQLIIAIAEIISNDFDLKKLLILLKNPLINSRLARKLELVFSGKNRFTKNLEQMLAIIKSMDDQELIDWLNSLIDLLYTHYDNEILVNSIKIAEKLYKDIWYEQGAVEAAKFFSELIELHSDLMFSNKKNLPAILRTLLNELQYFSTNNFAPNIFIGKPSDLALISFDLIILADFNDENWPPPLPKNPWLNNQMQEKLKLDTTSVDSSMALYYFYLFLHNRQIIISRASKQPGKTGILPSKYLLKLQTILGASLVKNKDQNSSNCFEQKLSFSRAETDRYTSSMIHSPNFPNIISVTDIELLIRNPYSFYVKKILNLREIDKIGTEPKISEFGNFIHKILDLYTKNYLVSQNKAGKNKDKIQRLLEFGAEILQNIVLPDYTAKIWQIKLLPIATAFIEFDEERRLRSRAIYSEVKGEFKLNILGQEINIIGVADRIEIDQYGRVAILDYKTGTLPSKKDIESGISPQTIILALMALEGGFIIGSASPLIPHEIIYVKLASSKPYIQTIEISLTKPMLNIHKQGLTALLEYYLTNKNFSKEINLLQYNPYEHMARKS